MSLIDKIKSDIAAEKATADAALIRERNYRNSLLHDIAVALRNEGLSIIVTDVYDGDDWSRADRIVDIPLDPLSLQEESRLPCYSGQYWGREPISQIRIGYHWYHKSRYGDEISVIPPPRTYRGGNTYTVSAGQKRYVGGEHVTAPTPLDAAFVVRVIKDHIEYYIREGGKATYQPS